MVDSLSAQVVRSNYIELKGKTLVVLGGEKGG